MTESCQVSSAGLCVPFSLPGSGTEATPLPVCVMRADAPSPALHGAVPARSLGEHANVYSSCATGGSCSHSVAVQQPLHSVRDAPPAAAVQIRLGRKAWLTQGLSCSRSLDKDSAYMMTRGGKKAAAPPPVPADVPAVVNQEVEGGPNPFEDMLHKSFGNGSLNV